jgi:hypothetical protein
LNIPEKAFLECFKLSRRSAIDDIGGLLNRFKNANVDISVRVWRQKTSKQLILSLNSLSLCAPSVAAADVEQVHAVFISFTFLVRVHIFCSCHRQEHSR